MHKYLDILRHVKTVGQSTEGRTKEHTISAFGYSESFDLSNGQINAVTTKKLYFKAIIYELLWFINGDTNIQYLKDNNVHIWDEWADENGDLGPVYGHQWRNFGGDEHTPLEERVDQLTKLMNELKYNKHSRRHIVSAWNPKDVNKMALPPCHSLFQMHIDNYDNLSLQLYQRSADLFLGLPFNIMSYSILTHMIAHVLGYKAHRFHWVGGDIHIYHNHLAQVDLQLTREPRNQPKLTFARKVDSIFDFKYEDFIIDGYDPHPAIKGEVSV